MIQLQKLSVISGRWLTVPGCSFARLRDAERRLALLRRKWPASTWRLTCTP